MVALVVASGVAFVATNVDDLVVLLLLIAAGARMRVVVAGQYAAFGGGVLVSRHPAGAARRP